MEQTQQSDPKSAEGQAARLEHANQQVAALLRQPQVAARLRAAGPDDWSAVQVLGHMIELIGYWTAAVDTLAAATGEPPRFGRAMDAPERLEAVAHGATSDPEALLGQLDGTVRAAAADIRRMTPAQRARTGIHNRRGELSVAEAFEVLVVGHMEEHVGQIQQALGSAA